MLDQVTFLHLIKRQSQIKKKVTFRKIGDKYRGQNEKLKDNQNEYKKGMALKVFCEKIPAKNFEPQKMPPWAKKVTN